MDGTPSATPEATSKASWVDPEPAPRFNPDEEAAFIAESQFHKQEANKLFAESKYDDAIARYQDALAACPTYLGYDLAVLRSNLAACYLKLDQWKEAIKCATDSIEGLDKLERGEAEGDKNADDETVEGAGEPKEQEPPKDELQHEDQESEAEEEIVSAGAAKAGPPVSPPPKSAEPVIDPEAEKRRKKQEDIKRIRAKALMRRARARSELGGWSNLSGAEEDYKALAAMDNLGPADRKIVQSQLRVLPPRTKAAQEKETAEMWGKLKDLGNGLLKPFGLSTDNFQMVKDEKTGGYNMNFKSDSS